MKLLQLNTWSLRLNYSVQQLIDAEAPDILTLQEVLDAKQELGFFPSIREFQESTHKHHRYFSPFYRFHFMNQSAEFGNAILSNLTLEDSDTIFTNGTYVSDFSFADNDYNVRNLQHVVVRNEHGTPIHILNHHGYHVAEHKHGNDFTLEACQVIAEYIDRLNGPIILAGDFNLVPDSPSLVPITDRLRNLSTDFGLTTTRNHLTSKTEVCDYIFVNDKVSVDTFSMSDAVVSDHNALILEFHV